MRNQKTQQRRRQKRKRRLTRKKRGGVTSRWSRLLMRDSPSETEFANPVKTLDEKVDQLMLLSNQNSILLKKINDTILPIASFLEDHFAKLEKHKRNKHIHILRQSEHAKNN